MSTTSVPLTGSLWSQLRAATRERLTRVDRPAWRRFFLALFGLALSFFLALYSTALRQSGYLGRAAVLAVVSLAVAAVVAVKTVPYLARRTVLERWMPKIEYELTREGLVYLVIIAVIAVAALNTGNNLLFMMLASLLAGILVSGILSKIVLSKVELEFALPEHIFAGQPVVARLTLRNLKWLFPSFSLTVSGARNNTPGFAWRARRRPAASSTPILPRPVYTPHIPHRSLVGREVKLFFPRRGRYTEEGLRVSTKFPFGLLRKARPVPLRTEVLVLPRVEPTEEFYEILPLLSGEIESLYKGRGHDLYSIRDYQETDSARHVDWKATAKAQQLKVREFTREDERRLVLVLDRRVEADDERRRASFERAVNLSASLAWHFYEIDAQMQFLTDGFATAMERAAEVIYPTLAVLAEVSPLVGPGPDGRDLLRELSRDEHCFHIILTRQPRGSIPTNLWGSSYMIFVDSL